jgi:hypothetical protein
MMSLVLSASDYGIKASGRVVGCPFLLPIYRALGAVYVQDDPLMPGSHHMARSIHAAFSCSSPFWFSLVTRTSVSNRLKVLVLAACFGILPEMIQ